MAKKRTIAGKTVRAESKGSTGSTRPSEPRSFTVVGVGAAAGGFEAFSQLLKAMPANPGLSIIFVQHLAPRHESALTTLLGGHTRLPVVEVTEGVRLESNRVYVI